MSRIMYNEVLPLNSKAEYKELETLDFVLDFPDKKLVLDTIRLEGLIAHEAVAGTRNTNEAVQFDGRVGVHNLIDSISVEIQNQGIIETISTDYGKMVRMLRDTSLEENEYFQASKVCELCIPSDRITRELTRGTEGGTQSQSFSFKPMISLNSNAGGDGTVSYRKTGYVKISINLNRNSNFYHGVGNTATQQFVLSKLKCKYNTVEDDGLDKVNVLKTSYTMKNSMNSDNSNISSKVPAVCSGVSMSFLKQTTENDLTANTLNLERPEGISQVDFLFNDTNKYIQYSLTSEEEYLSYAIESLKAVGVSGANAGRLKANDGFLLGLRFNSLVDLSMNKFTVQIQRANSEAFILYQVFHSSITL